MQRIAIGLAVGVAAWVGSALQAEAQVTITPIDPVCIHTGATTTTYTATVSNISTIFTFNLTVSLNGVQQCFASQLVAHTGTSANVTFNIDFTQWLPPYAAVKGDVINFHAQVKVGFFQKATNDYPITVTDPTSWIEGSGTRVLASQQCVLPQLETVDRDRREWA